MSSQVRANGIGRIVIAPYDVHIDRHNTFQPDLMYVSNDRLHRTVGRYRRSMLPDSTRRDLNDKLPVYAANGVPKSGSSTSTPPR